jgi:small nuclear ribonucleoprotein (snRNP)-like protein
MYGIKTMHLLLTIAAIILCSCVSIHAQDSTVQPESRHIVILNKKYGQYEPFKELNIGDEVRLILTNSKRVKGHITSIDSTFFTVETNIVHLNEIVSISTKNKKT